MKTITVNNIILYYETNYNMSDVTRTEWTEFWYNEPEYKTVKLFKWFGPILYEIVTEPDFIINFDIESKSNENIIDAILAKMYEKK